MMLGVELKKLWIDLKKTNGNLSPLSLIFILLSIAVIILFIFFSILPGQKSIKKIRQDIISVTTDIKVFEEKFVPAYAKAKKFERIKFEPKFSLPKRESLDRENLSELPNKFHLLALEHNLKLSNKKLNLAFLKTKSNSISMLLELDGRLQDFRNYLIVIISLPFFDSFEKIKINSTRNNIKNFSVDLKINIK